MSLGLLDFGIAIAFVVDIDMARAFLIHLADKEYTKLGWVVTEFSARDGGDYEFAAIYGLI